MFAFAAITVALTPSFAPFAQVPGEDPPQVRFALRAVSVEPAELIELVTAEPARARSLVHELVEQACLGLRGAQPLSAAARVAQVLLDELASPVELELVRALGEGGDAACAERRRLAERRRAALEAGSIGDFAAAEAESRAALAIAVALGDEFLQARERELLGRLLADAGQLEAAASELATALDLFQRSGLERELATCESHVAGVAFRRGRYREALALCEAANERAASLGDPSPVDPAHLAALSANLGRTVKAREYMAEALERATGDPTALAYLHRVRASLESYRARYGEAIRAAHEARRLARETGDRAGEGTAWIQLAGFFSEIGDLAEAEAAIERGLAVLDDVAATPERALARRLHGLTLIDAGDFAAGLARSREAVVDLARLDHTAGVADAHHQCGRALLGLARPEEAAVEFATAERMRAEVGDFYGAALSRAGSGDAFLGAGRPSKARAAYVGSLEAAERSGCVQALWRAHLGLGRLSERAGREAEALEAYRRAAAVLEDVRRMLGAPALRLRFLGTKLELYRRASRLAARSGLEDEGFRFAQAVQARTLLEVAAARPPDATRDPFPEDELGARWRRAEEELAELELRFTALQRLEVSEAWRRELATRLESSRAEHRSLRLELELSHPRRSSLSGVGEPPALAEIQEALGPSQALLAYLVGPSGCGVWVVRRASVRWVELEATAREVETRVTALFRPFELLAQGRTDLANLRFDVAAAERLYDMLIAPLEGELRGCDLLWIIPDGPLRRLPFALLVGERTKLPLDPDRLYAQYAGCRFLIEDYALAVLPAAGLAVHGRSKAARKPSGAWLAVADPEGDPAHTGPLPGAREEVREVCRITGAEPRIGIEGGERLFKTESPAAGGIHLAVHGVLDDRRPAYSNLWLGSGEGEDGRLHAYEIEALDLRAATVVLSACESAGSAGRGEGLLGLSRAFLSAGVRSVVATSWRVDDRASGELMRRFYEELGTTGSPEQVARALRRAQVSLLREGGRAGLSYVHPFFWAGFLVIGG